MIADKIKKGLAIAFAKTGGAAQAVLLIKRETIKDPIFGDKIEEEKIILNNAIVQKNNTNMISGDLISSNEILLIIDGDQVVSINDHFIADGVQYIAAGVEQIKPAGVLLASKIQGRRV